MKMKFWIVFLHKNACFACRVSLSEIFLRNIDALTDHFEAHT